MACLLLNGLVPFNGPRSRKSSKIVLLGRTGAGKSATGNTILGEKKFLSKFGAKTVTRQCQAESADVSGRRVTVLDTPGLYDTKHGVERITDEIQKVKEFSGQGKCVFLLVIALDRFTEEEENSVRKIKELFSDVPFSKFMILFTCGDKLEGTFEDFLKDADDEFLEVMKCFGNRYHVFNNKAKPGGKQVHELLKKIDKMLIEREDGHHQPIPQRDKVDVTEDLDAVLKQVDLTTDKSAVNSEDVTEEDMGKPPLRIVLLGKTGVGKSATGNTILGKNVFESKSGPYSLTKRCQREEGSVCGREVSVVDTPGFFDSELPADELEQEAFRSVTLSAPGPHCFLMVISLQDRFTKEGKNTIEELHKRFGDKLKKYTMILLSHSDTLNHDKIVKDILKTDSELSKLIRPFENRIHCFDNSDQSNRDQVRELLEKIDRMGVQNGGGYYTDEMYRRAEEAVRAEEERLHKEHDEEIRQRAEEMFQERLRQLGERGRVQISDDDVHIIPEADNDNAASEGTEQRGPDENRTDETLWQKIKKMFKSLWKKIKSAVNKLLRRNAEDSVSETAPLLEEVRTDTD